MDARLLFGLLIIALLMAGCAAPAAGTQNAPAAAAPAKQAPGPQPVGEAPTAATPPANDLFATWQKMLAAKPQEYHVQYKMVLGGAGTGASLVDQYFKGGVQRRTDTHLNQGGTTQNIRVFYLEGGATVTCMETGGKETCFKSEPAKTQPNTQTQLDVKNYEPNPDDFQPGQITMAKEPDRVIAGAATECYKIIYPKKETAEMSYCYTSDGIAMYVTTSSGTEGFSMEAQKLERSVQDSDLVAPPAKSLEEMYNIPSGIQG